MDADAMFDSDRYTQKSMPVCSELCRIITEELVQVSDEIMECREKNNDDYEEFYNSLSSQQRDLYERYWEAKLEEYTMGLTEHFNMGMYFGSRLAVELLKNSL